MELQGLEVTWLGHAAVRVRADDGTTVLIDPWLEGNPSCPESEHTQERVDAIFVTHGHFDHLGDTVEIAKATGAQVHAIHEIAVWLEAVGVGNTVGSNKGGTLESVGGIRASLTTAIHSSGISGDEGIVPGGEAGGWVLEFPNGPTLYHAGDTMVFGDMALIGEIWQPDIAFLPIGGWYTMGPRQAAMAARRLEVPNVVPIHYGTFPILSGTPAELIGEASGAFEVAELEIGSPVR
ncbi:MAG TPA: metal-dependent hydrolase [Acidimicrobiia bacterium]|nr:metal-dependent hydrolase [Acidimicrobiia bacterium]